ncbi:MAG TPA: DUF1704 domain-containing protein, partial [Candidatus Gracilibacteria bacterium]|nr:DUF1704 domain-containing protein [Candidatus Gracilibacteria bacterium]
WQVAKDFCKVNTLYPDYSPNLSFNEIKKQLENTLHKYRLDHWKIRISDNCVSDVSVNKHHEIILKNQISLKQNHLKALIRHEIETHVFRLENAKLQNYRIWQRGTAGYLQTEEGLAIFQQNQLPIPLGEKIYWPAWRLMGVILGLKMGFKDLFWILQSEYNLSPESAWKTAVKVKRGYENTAQVGAFSKDAIYFLGYQEVKTFWEQANLEDKKALYSAKMKISDLDLWKSLNHQVGKFFPSNL